MVRLQQEAGQQLRPSAVSHPSPHLLTTTTTAPSPSPPPQAAVEARAEIRGDTSTDRELLYLDLALQDVVRAAAERGAGARNAVALVGPLLENLCLSYHDNEELCFCLKAWQELPESISRGRGRPSENDALQAMAVVDRVRRALAHVSGEGVAGVVVVVVMVVIMVMVVVVVVVFVSRTLPCLRTAGLSMGLLSRHCAWRGSLICRIIALSHPSPADETQARIGAASASMGRAFGCENWAVELFAEEVIRGGPAFAVSLVLGSGEGGDG